MSGGGWFWTQAEWSEWSDMLASLIPDADISRYANPEGAQESIVAACLRAYVAERAGEGAMRERVEAAADLIEREGHMPELAAREIRAAITTGGAS